MKCPTPEILRQYTLGQLSLEAIEAIGQHIEDCSECQQQLEAIDSLDDPLFSELRGLMPATPDEAELLKDYEKLAVAKWTPAIHPAKSQVRCPHCHSMNDTNTVGDDGTISCGSCQSKFVLADEQQHKPAERMVAHFELLEYLGSGSFGVVWKARDTHLGRYVAIKLPRHGSMTRNDAFLHEAKTAAQLQHRNIVQILEISNDEHSPYIASEYIEGLTLKEMLQAGPLSAREAAHLIKTLTLALQTAHDKGVIHRDLKPSNILMDQAGEPHIADFGIARYRSDDVTISVDGKILGTPQYMSPEQAMGNSSNADARSDIYSLGAIAYELLTGTPPFRGDLPMVVRQIMFDEPVPPRKLNSTIPADLETVCLKCLEKRPGSRYASASALAADLTRFLDGEPVHARQMSTLEKSWRWCKRHPVGMTISVSVLLTGIICLLMFVQTYMRTVDAYQEVQTANGKTEEALSKAEEPLEQARENLYFLQIGAAHQQWLSNDHEMMNDALRDCPEEYRNFEWYYLHALNNYSCYTLEQATGGIAFHPNGREMMTGGGGYHHVKFWDVETRELLATGLEHSSHVAGVDYSPDGKLAVSAGGNDPTLVIWDAVTHEKLWKYTIDDDRVESPHFTADGKQIICTNDMRNIICVDLQTKAIAWEKDLDLHPIRHIAVSKQQNRMACVFRVGENSALRVWDYEKDEILLELPDQGRVFSRVAISSDGNQVAVPEVRGTIWVWDIASGETVALLPGPAGGDSYVAFSPDNTKLVYSGMDSEIHVWDIDNLREMHQLRGSCKRPVQFVFSRDGKWLASNCDYNQLYIWDPNQQQGTTEIKVTDSEVCRIVIGPKTGKMIASFRSGIIKVWHDIHHGDDYLQFECSGIGGGTLELSPDERYFATTSREGMVYIYDTDSGELVNEFWDHGAAPIQFAFCPQQDLIVSTGEDRQVVVRHNGSSEILTEFEAGDEIARSIAFHPDGKRIALGGIMGTVSIWDWTNPEKPVAVMETTGYRCSLLKWSPDGTQLLSGHDNGTFLLHDTEHYAVRHRFYEPTKTRLIDAAFSPDGSRVATIVNQTAVSLWDTKSGRQVLTLQRNGNLARCIAFHPDGKTIAAGRRDGTIMFWHAKPVFE